MRVGPVSAYRMSSGSARVSGTVSTGFAVASPAARTQATSAASAPVGVGLMPVGDLFERRRDGARRGRAIIEALDQLKLALLSGGPTDEALGTLLLANGSIDAGDDPGLAAVLDSIGLRADVELAKASMRRRRGDSQG